MGKIKASGLQRNETQLVLNDAERRELSHHEQVYAAERENTDLILDPKTFLQDLDRNDVVSRYDINRLALERMGDLKGKAILDFGCGDGRFGVFFALMGAAQVKGFDLSSNAVDIARERGSRNGVQHIVEFHQMPAHALSYESETFDLVFGHLVAHHIPVERLRDCGREVHRVLKKNGKAIFVEPLGENPLLELIRRHPFYDKWYASPDESSLTYQDIYAIGYCFSEIRCCERHLLYMAKRVVKNRYLLGALKDIDDALLRAVPALRKYCGEIVIEYVKEGSTSNTRRCG